jgi:hypothetical protein
VVFIPDNHRLIGTWITDDEDSEAAFTFSVKNKKIRVSGFSRSDGEAFEITHLKWDGKILSFTARMPSTDTVTKNTFRVRRDGRLDFELTTYEVWKKKNVKPGEIPEAWQGATPYTHIRRATTSRKGSRRNRPA